MGVNRGVGNGLRKGLYNGNRTRLWKVNRSAPTSRLAFEFYLANQDAMVVQYNGRFIVIKDDEVVGAYDSDLEAVTKTKKVHSLGTFLVQKVSAGEADYTAAFHSSSSPLSFLHRREPRVAGQATRGGVEGRGASFAPPAGR